MNFSGTKDGTAGLLSRTSTKRSSHNPDNLTAELSSLSIAESEKGPLGLTTLNPTPSSNPTADVIFIHGLGGGSRKTWSFSPNPDHFWPQSWLPSDPDFADVRFHTFGYKADWADRQQSALNIRDFAQSLLSELKNSLSIRRYEKTRIVLVGHSMGGCVAKKAYILARQDPTCHDLVRRFHSIFFIGTPHRGSNLALTLENMITMGWVRKPFVRDLIPGSDALGEINESFRHYAPDLKLWSFYETLPVRTAVLNKIIVEKDSATLGYPGEEIAALDADHRQVCKFETPANPNFKTLRNALLTSVDLIRAASDQETAATVPTAPLPIQASSPTLAPGEEMSRLSRFLDASPDLEDDLLTLQLLREPGSCKWFAQTSAFSSWKAGTAPEILWVTGRPAAGKSILSSYVVDQFATPKSFCSHFFFKHGVEGKRSLSDCLRSLVFQMATHDADVLRRLLKLDAADMVWDKEDEVSVWRKLITGCIGKLPSIKSHYWVLDGLDECHNFGSMFSKKILASLPRGLRVFVAARDLEELQRGLASLGARVHVHTLSESDTAADMRLFLQAKLEELGRLDSEEERGEMCEKILHKASGSFLWVRLILQELEKTWTRESMEEVLQEVPVDLQEMYLRILRTIQNKSNTELAKTILRWVVLSSRPLTVDELCAAVRLDVNQTLQNGARAIPTLCGQLVFVNQANRVQIIHETARQFLTSPDCESEMVMVKPHDHTRLGMLLLRLLSVDVLKQRHTRPTQGLVVRSFCKTTAAPLSSGEQVLMDYAANHFSDHVCPATAQDDDLAEKLCVFLTSRKLLTWMEHLAKKRDLGIINKSAMNLRAYLSRRVEYVPPTDRSVLLIDSWLNDLIRVAAKFSSQLVSCPSAIHTLIPPLCPPDSAIHTCFAADAKFPSLAVAGLRPGTWDDCLAYLDFEGQHAGGAIAVVHGQQSFAVGFARGNIAVFDRTSVQLISQLTHTERLQRLEMSPEDQYLVSSGRGQVIVWDMQSGSKLHVFSPQGPPLAVTFLGSEELLCVTKSCQIIVWDLETKDQQSLSWKARGATGGFSQQIPSQPPVCAAFLKVDTEVLLAVGYRTHPVYVLNALQSEVLGNLVVPSNTGLVGMVFNQNPEIPALLVNSSSGSLHIFNYHSMSLESTQVNLCAGTISCSQDGRSLVVGGEDGVIRVFEFDLDLTGRIVLHLFYCIDSLEGAVRGAAFSSDGLRFLEIRSQQCRIWAPAALVRKDNELESTSDAVSLPPQTPFGLKQSNAYWRSRSIGQGSEISTSFVVPHGQTAFVVAGKRDGKVVAFSVNDAKELKVLYQHPSSVATLIIAGSPDYSLLISADSAGYVHVSQMGGIGDMSKGEGRKGSVNDRSAQREAVESQCESFISGSLLLKQRFSDAGIAQILASPASDRLYISGYKFDELWELPSGKFLAKRPHSDYGLDLFTKWVARSAFQHPENDKWLTVVVGNVAHILSWETLEDLSTNDVSSGITLLRRAANEVGTVTSPLSHKTYGSVSSTPSQQENSAVSYHKGPGFCVEMLHRTPSEPCRLHVWLPDALDPASPDAAKPASDSRLTALEPMLLAILGFVNHSTLVFLDTGLWVCSIQLGGTDSDCPLSLLPSRSGTSLSRGSSFSSPPLGGRQSFSRTTSSVASTPEATVPGTQSGVTARRHFFALPEWRAYQGELQCTMVMPEKQVPLGRNHGTSPDFVFANGEGIIVVKSGLEFSELVTLEAPGITAPAHSYKPQASPEDSEEHICSNSSRAPQWQAVPGSTHRRAPGW
ncbi:hypothetical protein PspLS_05923 [Pyricularia sp. CBS 133598]|nr:hypothetical protein PspLS_05923 [Pyricularia sp. CBS 133598]